MEHGRDGLLFQRTSRERFSRKEESSQSGKKSEARLTTAFFVSAAGEKVIEPIVIWRSGKQRCFKNVLVTCITIQVKNDGWQANYGFCVD